MEHKQFFQIVDELNTGDLLIVNETKVFNARLEAKTASDRNIEIFLLRPDTGNTWRALAKPGKRIKQEDVITFTDQTKATIQEKCTDGTIRIELQKTPKEILEWTSTIGQVPIPPYVEEAPSDASDYQTVYAKHTGSVAAPTAGFHFTQDLIKTLKEKGIEFATITLHVGMGTFKPLQSETLEEHIMHEEWISIPKETRKQIKETHANGHRVIAIGTTSVRALESGIAEGFTNIFIKPGYRFKTIDGMITNFHLPKSTLMVLVSAFAGEKHKDQDEGRKMILHAYQEAIANNYRFYSFGDAMFIK